MEYLNQKNSLQIYLSKIQYLFFVAFILCIPFQDFGLQGTFLRYFGINLSNIPLVGVVIIAFLKFLLGESINKKVFMLCSWLLIYIIGYSLLMLIVYDNSYYYIQNIYKICSNFFILIFWIFAYVYTKKYANTIGKYIVIANLIHIIGWILCDIVQVDLGTMIHYTHSINYPRFHGFTLEASTFCFTAVILGFLSICYIKRKIIKIIFGILIVTFIIFGGSKGSLVCVLISSYIYILFGKRYNFIIKLLLLLLMMLISFLGIYYILLDAFIIDLEEATSFASRFSSMLSIFYILYDYPLGTGFGVFIPIFKVAIVNAFDLLNSYTPGINLGYSEIDSWINSTDGEGAVIRSIVIQFMAYWGIPFIVCFVYYIKYMMKNIVLYDKYLWLFIFIICGLLTFAMFNYDAIIALAIIYSKIKVEKIK